MSGGRLISPAAERNLQPITERLAPLLEGRSGTVLEIGSGSGQHAAHWAARFPGLDWRPSDPDPAARASIAAWAAEAGRGTLRPPLALDARAPWPIGGPLAAVIAVNVLHVSPWSVAEAIVAGAAARLPPGGLLIFYGPFREGGDMAESNRRFDAGLRARDPDWGIRDREAVERLVAEAGFGPAEVAEMPANNRLLRAERAPGG